jgi:hypothetical protein
VLRIDSLSVAIRRGVAFAQPLPLIGARRPRQRRVTEIAEIDRKAERVAFSEPQQVAQHNVHSPPSRLEGFEDSDDGPVAFNLKFFAMLDTINRQFHKIRVARGRRMNR